MMSSYHCEIHRAQTLELLILVFCCSLNLPFRDLKYDRTRADPPNSKDYLSESTH